MKMHFSGTEEVNLASLDPFYNIEDIPIETVGSIPKKVEEEYELICSECNQQYHYPCSCDHAKQWHTDRKQQMIDLTKPCPLCKQNNTRETGSNRLCCEKCDGEYCFICEKNWDGHGHCLKPTPNIEPLDFYSQIYNYCELAESITQKELEQGMAALLKSVTLTLVACHVMLKYCAVFAYYTKPDNRQFFRMWNDLEREVQDLHDQASSFVLDLDEVQRSHERLISQYNTMKKYI